MLKAESSLFAGFDCSTQSFSVVVIDTASRSVVYRDAVVFDEPFERTAVPGEVVASPNMWASALDTLLHRLGRGIDLRRLRAISGAAQQHGSVYCGAHPREVTRHRSPIWMDTSTSPECKEIEAALGGPAAVAGLTGSRAFPRFTAPQIRKFAREAPEAYARTERIHLVSSFLASLLTGEHGPIDHADGSGTNLMDLRTREWADAALAATAPDLARRLPPLTPSSSVIGTLANEWQSRYKLPPVRIVAWSGDNPCSLVGTGVIDEGEIAISLGTSDTIFGPMNAPRVSEDGTGHVFASPTGAYMGITVFSNGSLARERVRADLELDWSGFSDALRTTPAGNEGGMMLPWFEPEITPRVQQAGVRRTGLDGVPGARTVRALIEAQMMALRNHSEWMGVTPRRIHATGGASVNPEILQVMADVFDAEVNRLDSPDSAALGAALRAYQADTRLPWKEVVDGFVTPDRSLCFPPIAAHATAYGALRRQYAAWEREQSKLANS